MKSRIREGRSILLVQIRPRINGTKYQLLYDLYVHRIRQWYSTFFVRVPPELISLQLFYPQSC
jgi:hypothetical protein